VKYKSLVIAREYGSGGAEIAAILAKQLGWRLVDRELLAEISGRARVPESEAAALDEQLDPWLHRLIRPLWGTSGDGVSLIAPVDLFDADAAATWTRRIIDEAYATANCVIVGRGAQCILHGKPDVFQVFVYASRPDRVRRVQARVGPGTDVDKLLQTMDDQRLHYIRRYHDTDRLDPHLYDLMINAHDHSESAAAVILRAMEVTH
jgi:cytidylate kinase